MFIKENYKHCSFLKTYGRNPYIFEFLRENFPKLAKMLLKKDFYETFCIFRCKKCFERNVWVE